MVKKHITPQEAEIIRDLVLLPAIAMLSGVSHKDAYKLTNNTSMKRVSRRAARVIDVAKQLVDTAKQLKQTYVRRKPKPMRCVKLYHIHDLGALQADIWKGDRHLVAQLVGVKKELFKCYLSGKNTPRKKICKLAWRVLLAKIESNRAFEQAWLGKQEVSTSDFRNALQHLFPHDRARFRQLSGCPNRYYTRWIDKVKAGATAQLPQYMSSFAAAVVLRAKYNKQFLAQIAPWLAELQETHQNKDVRGAA